MGSVFSETKGKTVIKALLMTLAMVLAPAVVGAMFDYDDDRTIVTVAPAVPGMSSPVEPGTTDIIAEMERLKR